MRAASATGVPPGCRTATTRRPSARSRAASQRTSVDFPAPSMLPRPPMITTANDTMITPTEMPGDTEIIGAVKAPPIAARKMPIVKASMYTRDTLTPMLDAISAL